MNSRPRNPRRRLLMVTVTVAILIILVIFLFKPLILPIIARSVIQNQLASAGLQSASFTLDTVDFSSARIRNLKLGSHSPHTLPQID
ncbi:MAG TPA: hypothetical protein VG711_09510, partial [Phycisphaerales bacterium]|nr:hypothetical protein [Phycisphaerales bacterium]